MKDPIVLSNAARHAALESLGVVLGSEFAPNAIASHNYGATMDRSAWPTIPCCGKENTSRN